MSSKSQKIDGRLKEGSASWTSRNGSRTRAEVGAELDLENEETEKQKERADDLRVNIQSRTGAAQTSNKENRSYLTSVRDEVVGKKKEKHI